MKTKKNDFIELEFTGKTKEGQVFDTTNAEEAKKIPGLNEKDYEKIKPLKLCIGQTQVLKSLDKELEDKEIEKEYAIEIKAKEAYGLRNSKLIRTVPLSAFEEMPQRGMFVNVNGMAAKVISITSGRVLIDMNHPLAGKDLVYNFKILRILEDNKEKIQSFLESFSIESEIEIKENKATIKTLKLNEKLKQELSKKIKELISIESEFLEKEVKKEEPKEEKEDKTKEQV